ncbi:lysozyme inhibitor LprI family protein [Burkholderia gladioli]|uniref:lysozyme inhibitor LprI family protein n=1 Tax=Burkholderia gladioli TaxID=28095 RepID=UPI00163EC631|nr:lysozyme inhibitor LprI family protein [Burkholderia gladioli]
MNTSTDRAASIGKLLIATLAILSSAAQAAGFDCANASSPTEQRICADAQLSKQDETLQALYAQVPASPDWRADQRAWLARRDACGDDACLRNLYADRIVVLRHARTPFHWGTRWQRVDAGGHDGAQLDITQVNERQFSFSFDAVAGVNSGALSETARFSAPDTASYVGDAKMDTQGCVLTFRRVLNRLEVEQQGGAFACGAGVGVSYGGDYVAAARDPNAEPSLLSLGVASTPAQDAALRKLLGRDYRTMVATASVVDTQADNLDGNGARVVGMFVQGVACDTKSVLMSDAQGHLWAGVWEAGAVSAPAQLRYYTNVAADKQRLPRTIAAANAETCPGEPVSVRMMP